MKSAISLSLVRNAIDEEGNNVEFIARFVPGEEETSSA